MINSKNALAQVSATATVGGGRAVPKPGPKPLRPSGSDFRMGEHSWSLLGKVLKLNTAEDLEPHLASLRASRNSVEQVIVSGNTFGVDAAKALAVEIKQLKNLKVSPQCAPY